MDGVINVRVNGYSVVKDHNCAGAQYESGSTQLMITFDEVWNKFVKTVTFWDALGQNPTKIVLGIVHETESKGVYSVPIPGEVLKEAGTIFFTIDGYKDGVIKRTAEGELKVLPSRKAEDAAEPTEPTPTPHEQLQLEIAATEEKMKEFYQGGETDTVETEVGYVTEEVYDLEDGGRVQVQVAENDVEHTISSTNLESTIVIEVHDYENNRTYVESFRGSVKVPQKILSLGKKYGYDIRSEAKSTITVEKTSDRKKVLAELKEGSVGFNHLGNEVVEKINEGQAMVEELRADMNEVSDQMPTKVSQLTNDKGYLSEETDPTVPDWAKQPTKPTYTADEVGAIPQDAANSQSGTITLFYDGVRKVVEAYVKEGSINKDHVTDEIITEDDIATTDKAGIVRPYVGGGLQMLPFSANDYRLAIKQATKQQIETKSAMFLPITPEMVDVAIAAGTHQEMGDGYDPALFYTCWDMEGKQGQLPVSYDAVKNYVDSQQGGGVTYGGGETDTIKTVIDNTTFEKHEVEAGGRVVVYVGENDVRHDLSAANTIIAQDIAGYDVDGNTVGEYGILNVFNGTSCTIDFNQFDAKVVYYEFMSPPENIITVKKTSTDLAILAEVKEGSIQPKHLAEEYCTKEEIEDIEAIAKGRATGYVFDTIEDLDAWLSNEENIENLVLGDNLYIRELDVPDYWWDGSAKQQLETQKVDLTEYVKNTDYATNDVAGVVKVQNHMHGLYVDNGLLRVYCAEKTEVDGKRSDKPLSVRHSPEALIVNTHQDMGDDYDISTVTLYSTYAGMQNKLPVSYDAVKGYVDGVVGDIDMALDNIITIQESLIGGGSK